MQVQLNAEERGLRRKRTAFCGCFLGHGANSFMTVIAWNDGGLSLEELLTMYSLGLPFDSPFIYAKAK